MKVAVAAFGLFLVMSVMGCVRATEGAVRDAAAHDFACADYALTVTEVGPDVFRASGCGQELIYACRASRPAVDREEDDVGDQSVMVCARSTGY